MVFIYRGVIKESVELFRVWFRERTVKVIGVLFFINVLFGRERCLLFEG